MQTPIQHADTNKTDVIIAQLHAYFLCYLDVGPLLLLTPVLTSIVGILTGSQVISGVSHFCLNLVTKLSIEPEISKLSSNMFITLVPPITYTSSTQARAPPLAWQVSSTLHRQLVV